MGLFIFLLLGSMWMFIYDVRGPLRMRFVERKMIKKSKTEAAETNNTSASIAASSVGFARNFVNLF
jgi:hypothetical protein